MRSPMAECDFTRSGRVLDTLRDEAKLNLLIELSVVKLIDFDEQFQYKGCYE